MGNVVLQDKQDMLGMAWDVSFGPCSSPLADDYVDFRTIYRLV